MITVDLLQLTCCASGTVSQDFKCERGMHGGEQHQHADWLDKHVQIIIFFLYCPEFQREKKSGLETDT
jgi:hypothetical protein